MNRRHAVVIWGLCAAVAVASFANLAAGVRNLDPRVSPFKQGGDLMWNLLSLEFGVLAALILSRQPGNRVGWLLMVPALVAIPEALIAAFVQVPATQPAALTLSLFLALWWGGWSWVPAIFAILLLPLLFPTGKPPSRRWGWVGVYALVLAAIFIFLVTFTDAIWPIDGERTWSLPSPVGFIPAAFLDGGLFMPLWSVNLVLLTLLSIASLVYRYRHAAAHERQQIKWLMYVCAVFALIYAVGVGINRGDPTPLSIAWGLLFVAGIAAIPLVITYSILRYRLFDIDLVIRRTLVYAAVTALLGLVFFGSIILLQRLFTALTGQTSPVALVASTLVIAALFSPLRRRVQDFVDRRFYRRKYDAQHVLAQFATVARDETDLERLGAELGKAVDGALQPSRSAIWLRTSCEKQEASL